LKTTQIYSRIAIGIIATMAVVTAAIAAPNTEVTIWVERNVAPSAKVRLTINTRNVPVVIASLTPIDGSDWLKRFDKDLTKQPLTTGKALRQWPITVASKQEGRQSDAYFNRELTMPIVKPGVYLLTVAGGGKRAWSVINVTNLGVIAKRSPTKMLVWVTNALKGNVVAGAKLAVYDEGGRKVASGSTGKDGVSIIPIKPGKSNVVVSYGADRAFVMATREEVDGTLRAHFQTDRPIYRPGQTIQYRAVIRTRLGQGYKNQPGVSAQLEFRDPIDNLLEKVDLKANAMGVVAGHLEVPEEGMLGNYSMVLHLGKQEQRSSVEVAEYRKPEYKVTITPSAKRRLAGEDVTFKLDSQYYFGAPVSQAEVTYEVTRAPLAFFEDRAGDLFDDGNIDPSDDYRGDPNVAAGTVHTDKDGKATISFKSKIDEIDSRYTIEATVKDASNREVSVDGEIPVYSAAIRLGLRTQMICVPLGGLIPVQVCAINLDGKPCSARVKLSLIENIWIEKEGRNKRIERARMTVQVPKTGKVAINLPAQVVGDLTVKATAIDASGRKALSEINVYVAGAKDKTVRESLEPEVTVKLDRRRYKPGDTVKAYFVTNQPKRPMLATLEGDDLWAYRVYPAGKSYQLWTIPTSTKFCPYASIEGAQWSNGVSHRGLAEFSLPDAAKAITLKVTPERTEYRPLDKATYRISTYNSAGYPIPAEVTLSVVDEAIYALREDDNVDLWELYWGPRESAVTTSESDPLELSGGAYQTSSGGKAGEDRKPVAPLRKRFEDTAYWNAFVETGADGKAEVSFEMPGNLTTWRATARGVNAITSVGTTRALVKANREAMLRLATPRQMVQGDQIQLIGTIDNRSAEEHEFEVSLRVTDIGLVGDSTQRIKVPAKSQGKVEWTLSADKLPKSGSAQLLGELTVPGALPERAVDLADALQVQLRVVPRGVEERLMVGGVVSDRAEANLTLPAARIADAGMVTVTAWAGLRTIIEETAKSVLDSSRYGSISAADHLEVASAKNLPETDKEVRESLAFLAKTQSPEGWGWWEDSEADPVITARIMATLGHARDAGITTYEKIVIKGKANLVDLFGKTNLWEYKAQLASSAAIIGEQTASKMLDQVLSNGQKMSPFARLQMAEALTRLGRKDDARKLVDEALKDASEGPEMAFFPSGDGIGWTASEIETTAQGLATLVRMGYKPALQAKVARWLVNPSEPWWHGGSEDSAIVRALTMYLKVHPESTTLGPVEISVAGHKIAATPAKVGAGATAQIPISWLTTGMNTFSVTKTESGNALFKVDARVFLPSLIQKIKGVQVMRRFEVRNAAGVWEELNRAVKTSEPVRCTVVVWGDDINDALRVWEPIPSGFEFIDNDYDYVGRSEVRDAAIIHYLVNGSTPQSFRFYIRAETEGQLTALPVTAEYVMRPSDRGQSGSLPIQVKEGK
jgi:uncharacterized protein YfaS (alpha-2-macroglobulin family)